MPVQSGSVDTASNISLGYFVVAALAGGQSTTYNNTPFSLTLDPQLVQRHQVQDRADRDHRLPQRHRERPEPVERAGHVQPDRRPAPSRSADGTGTLDLSNSQELLVPSSVNNGQTTLQAQVTTVAIGPQGGVPEPSTIALFLSMVGGLGLRRFVQNRRQRAAA